MGTRLSRTTRWVIGAGVALGSLGIGGAGDALASGGSAAAATTPTTTTASPTPAQRIQMFLRRHAVDATVILKTKNGYQTLSAARGTVTGFQGGQVTVTPPAGPALTATITARTRFRNTSAQQLGVGQRLEVVALDGNALVVVAPKPSPAS